jgi:NAD(P)-dependent dehydrogenase (short-subunit alcohol dehydrogenase family)
MAGRLQGKVAVITGASRGLGRYCALAYGAEGATVVVAARTETETNPNLPGTIHETVREIEAAGGSAFPVQCNVADAESIQAMTQTVLERYGHIDVLMTNAAIQTPGFISDMQPKHWELEFRVNVHGTFHCIRAVLPSMIEHGSGNIITISSIAAHSGGSHYGATKRAVESMSIGLANELRDKRIAVNCLRPVAAIETPGLIFGRSLGSRSGQAFSQLAGPESYVEAALLLATQTVDTCTGVTMTDAETVKRFDPVAYERFKTMNPPSWSAGIAN